MVPDEKGQIYKYQNIKYLSCTDEVDLNASVVKAGRMLLLLLVLLLPLLLLLLLLLSCCLPVHMVLIQDDDLFAEPFSTRIIHTVGRRHSTTPRMRDNMQPPF